MLWYWIKSKKTKGKNKMTIVTTIDPITKEKVSYYVDKNLLKLLERIKDKIQKKDQDYVMLIDGYERVGKSTIGIQIGKAVDPTLCLERICMTADEFKEAIINAKKGECIIFDEAVAGFGAGDSIARVGKILKSLVMQCGQKNLFIIIIIPSVFELNKYLPLSRARFMLHVYEKKGKLGYWCGFNRKKLKLTYILGKKNHAYKIKTIFSGRFFPKYAGIDDLAYRNKKAEALSHIDDVTSEMTNNQKGNRQADALMLALNKECGWTHQKIADYLTSKRMSMTHQSITYRINKALKLEAEQGISQEKHE